MTPLAILGSGLVTPVGLTTRQSTAALRAGVSNPTVSRFVDEAGDWITGHSVPMTPPLTGLPKLVRMCAIAITEALELVPRSQWDGLLTLLCIAEADRPGRVDGLDDTLLKQIEKQLGVRFSPSSMVLPRGRVSVALALAHAREVVAGGRTRRVLVAAVDSHLHWPTLRTLVQRGRLLSEHNSDGFLPGEAAGALLVGSSDAGHHSDAQVTGMGFDIEAVHIDSEQPFRAEGMSRAVRTALGEARCEMHQMQVRVADASGEAYYFKEAALVLSRLMRVQTDALDLLLPAECVGEVGAPAGAIAICVAAAVARSGMAAHRRVLIHLSNDAGARAALVVESRPSP